MLKKDIKAGDRVRPNKLFIKRHGAYNYRRYKKKVLIIDSNLCIDKVLPMRQFYEVFDVIEFIGGD